MRRTARIALALAALVALLLLLTVGQLHFLDRRLAPRPCREIEAEERPEDRVSLPDAPAMTHLSSTFRLPDGSAPSRPLDLVCGDLVNAPDALPPDPRQLLLDARGANPPSRSGAIPLRILTFNAALLDVWVGPFHYDESPLREERRQVLFDRLMALDPPPDVILLQEVWLDEDARPLVEQAAATGYVAASWRGRAEGRRERRRDVGGELTLVKREHVGGATEGRHFGDDQVDAVPYLSQVADEQVRLPGKVRFTRGWLETAFEHPHLGEIAIFNTHMHAFPENWTHRRQAARQLGLAAARASAGGALVLVGGDVNSAPFYADDGWSAPQAKGGGRTEVGFRNAISWAALLHYGGLTDLAVRGWEERPDRDVVVGRTARNDPGFYDREVYGVSGKTLDRPIDSCPEAMRRRPPTCEANRPATFTATDCNGLFMKQYGGLEVPARLDHLLVADPDGRVHAISTYLVFVGADTVRAGECEVELSDHYGLLVDVYAAPPPDWRR